jgi:hypothetical protein
VAGPGTTWAAEGYVVALVDAASDLLAHNHDDTPGANGFLHGSGLRGHRLPNRLHGDKYLKDLAAAMNDLRGRYPNLRLWAVATSRGTISAAVAAANVSPPLDGIVLLPLSQNPVPWETCRVHATGGLLVCCLPPRRCRVQAVGHDPLLAAKQHERA